jgi:hypothetical protein
MVLYFEMVTFILSENSQKFREHIVSFKYN